MKKIVSVITVSAIVAMFVFVGFAITISTIWSFVGVAWSMIIAYLGSEMFNDIERNEEVEETEERTISEERA